MIEKSIAITNCKIIVYFNSDILFRNNIVKLLNIITTNNSLLHRRLLIVGRRGDINWKNVSNHYNHDLIWRKCKMHKGYGIDYFIFTKITFSFSDKRILNEIVVGRIRYDNIILSLVLINENNTVIDSTTYIKAIHLSISQKEKKNLVDVRIIFIYY